MDMQNQVTEVFNQVTSVTYFFVYKISKPFWVDCLQMCNDLPVTGLVIIGGWENIPDKGSNYVRLSM